jgi:hypothetical protein
VVFFKAPREGQVTELIAQAACPDTKL